MSEPNGASARPVDWDDRYRVGDTPWERGYSAPPLDEYLASHRVEGLVLVPGCGLGHDVRRLAGQGASPVGLDLAPFAIERARSMPAGGSETYRVGDFLNLPGDLCGAFDVVFEHTLFCAIPPILRIDYVAAAHRALRDAGVLLAIFFLEIEDPEGPPFPSTHAEIDELFHPCFDTVASWSPRSAYPGRENREEMRIMRKR